MLEKTLCVCKTAVVFSIIILNIVCSTYLKLFLFINIYISITLSIRKLFVGKNNQFSRDQCEKSILSVSDL